MRKGAGYGVSGNAASGRYTNLMPPRSTRTINVDGVALELAIERKNVNARLTGSALSVSAPRDMPQEAVDEAVLELARRLLRRAHASRVNEADDALKLARRVAKRFPKEPHIQRVVFVTTQRKRWGSYSIRTKTVRRCAPDAPLGTGGGGGSRVGAHSPRRPLSCLLGFAAAGMSRDQAGGGIPGRGQLARPKPGGVASSRAGDPGLNWRMPGAP